MHNITDVNAFTSPVPVLDDGDPVAASQTQPTIQALANRSFYTNSLLGLAVGMDNTASAGGTTTLTASSNERQYFSGSANQNIVLPNETTIPQGKSFFIFWNSTGIATVKDSGGATLFTIPGKLSTGKYLLAIASSTNNATPTGNWKYFFDQPGHMQGVVDGSAAAAGEIGEYKSISGSGSFATPNVAQQICSASLPLTAGHWLVSLSAELSWTPDGGSWSAECGLSLSSSAYNVTSMIADASGQFQMSWGFGTSTLSPSGAGMNFPFSKTLRILTASPITLFALGDAFWGGGGSGSYKAQAIALRIS